MYITYRMKKKINIPPEYKCSRCKRDLRDDVPETTKCWCDREHPLPINKTGFGIWLVEMQYLGFDKDFTLPY